MTIDYISGQPREQDSKGLAPFHEWIFPDGAQWAQFYRIDENYLIRFPELGDFDISADGLIVRAWPAPGITPGTIDHLYMNQVLPLVLSKLGKWVFHASAVEIGVGAVVFLAESGRGKSTLAAAFSTAGFKFLTDDVLLLEPTSGGFEVQPSHPSIRLWSDSQKALLRDDAQLAPPVQYTSKARLLSGGDLAFCRESRPLRRMYFLGDGSSNDVRIERMIPSEVLMGLVKNSFLLDIEAPDAVAMHFNRLADMAELPIYYRLDYPRTYEILPTILQAIVKHAAAEDS